jgi:hypothetical protein
MPEATATASPAPAASPSTASGASSAPAASMSQPATAGPQTTSGTTNMAAAAEAAMAGKGAKGVTEAFRPTPAPTPAAEQAPSNPQPAEPAGTADDTLGLSDKQVQALRRAHAWDPDNLRTFPLSNLKAYANKLAESQSQADREYQQRRQQAGNKPGEGQPAGSTAEADAGKDSAEAQKAQQDGQPPQTQPLRFSEQDISQFLVENSSFKLDPKESEALALDLGDEGVKAVNMLVGKHQQAMAAAMAKTYMQLQAPLVNAIGQVLGWKEQSEWTAGMTQLRQQPGYAKMDAPTETAFRKAVVEHVRSKGDPNYRFEQAIPEVAQRFFKVDPRLAAQAEIGRVADPMLASSGARPSAVAATPRPQTQEQRMAAAALAAMSGKGAQGAREAYTA